MVSERSKSQRQEWVRYRLSEYYSQFLYHYLIHTHTTNTFILISFKDAGDAGQAPTRGSRTSNSRRNSGIFARPGYRSQRRILSPATAPMNHLSSCSEGTKATCRRNCIYIYIHVYVWIINGGCETFNYIYIWSVLRENLFIYMHNVYNM